MPNDSNYFMSRNRRQSESKPEIFIEGGDYVYRLSRPLTIVFPGIHARKWISPATVTLILSDLVTDPRHNKLLDQWDFFILAVMNPDG